MTLEDKFKEAALNFLSNSDTSICVGFPKQDSEIIKFLYDRGVINDKEIEKALEVAIIEHARRDYDMMMRTKNTKFPVHPDHVGHPQYLAYALSHGVFSEKEKSKIRFDHGENVQEYCRIYGQEHLLAKLREKLLNPKPCPLLTHSGYIDSKSPA